MPTVELTCNDEPSTTTETPPPHLYICCGFEELPLSFGGSYSLESTKRSDCVALYGTGGTFTLSREPCGTIYSTPGLPFYLAIHSLTLLCCGNPNEENEHISNWGLGPGGLLVYSEDNYCQRDPDTGEVSFHISAQHVGADCLFTVTVDSVVMP